MKIRHSIFVILVIFQIASVQSQTISKEEYDKIIQFAVSETNADFPFVFEITSEFIENGEMSRKVVEVRERESPGYERITTTDVSSGRETTKYQLRVGHGNIFCSDDGESWISTRFECSRPLRIRIPHGTVRSEISVAESLVDGEPVKTYRAYLEFAPPRGSKTEIRSFRETISTIDSRGFFISVEDTEGTLDPRTVTFKSRQVWKKGEIKPIVEPVTN